jgi:lipoprotein-anchoring transpeptidase ErfK/SrfK
MCGKQVVSIGLVWIGFLTGTEAAHCQADTNRLVVDSTRKTVDSTRKTADTTKKSNDSTKKASDATTKADAPGSGSLRGVGKVDGPVRLAADLSERELTVIAANGALRTFKVAIGTRADPTPTGTFRIRKIVWNPSWVPPDQKWAKGQTAKGPGQAGNPMRVAKIFFREPDYYIHGTPYVNSLGTAASHGCLRMHPDEVAELAQFLMENGGQAREEGWFSRIIHLRWKTHTVTLSQPVSLTISQ